MADSVVKDLRRRMEGALDVLKKEFGGLRTGRASTALLDTVHVDAYGSLVPLTQCGNISVPEPRMLTVQVWDRAMVKAVEKAIRDAGLGLNPQSDGQLVRIPIPDLNEERRKELVKIAAKYGEQARISIRNVRRDGLDTLKRKEKEGEISQDEQRRIQTEVQSLTDDCIKKVDELSANKEKEILQV